MLKQTKNKTKTDSKTWCNLHNKVWHVVSISIEAYRHQNWVTHQPPLKELGWNSQESFLFKIFHSQNGN